MGVVNIPKLCNFIPSFHKTKSHSTDQISGNVKLDNLNSSFKPLNIPSCHLAGSGEKNNWPYHFGSFAFHYVILGIYSNSPLPSFSVQSFYSVKSHVS